MKSLYILRHAKSSWDDASLTDFERPLNERGRRAARFMGGLMARLSLMPSAIISSPAERARSTARLVKDGGNFSGDIQYQKKIYEANLQCLIGTVSEIDDVHPSVLIVGHNPAMEAIVFYLTQNLGQMPTAALAVVDLNVKSWKDLTAGVGKLQKIYIAREEMKKTAHTVTGQPR